MAQELSTTNIAALSLLPNENEMSVMFKMAKALHESKFLPESVQSPQAAFAIILKGRELGIPAMQAFASIHIIKGKPTLSAELMAALVYRAGHYLNVTESSSTKCSVKARRAGESEKDTLQLSWTIEQAKQAGLVISNRDGSPGNWMKYPDAMLRSRAISAICRIKFPDVISGMYTPDELGATVSYTPDGQEVIVEGNVIGQRQDIPPVVEYGDREPDEKAVMFFNQAIAEYAEANQEGRLTDIAERVNGNKPYLSQEQIDDLRAAHAFAAKRIKRAAKESAQQQEIPA